MTSVLERRRKRLRYRAWHRGTREADLILGRFADARLEGFGEAELAAFEALLGRPDPEIFDWILGKVPLPDDPLVRGLVASVRPSP